MADTLKTLTCPACGKEMEKIYIPTQGINLDICTKGCGGIFFDNREFDHFDEENEDITKILEALANNEFEKVDSSTTRVCPNCGCNMVKNSTSIHKQIEVDDCYSCGGKFLDNNELIKIREEYRNNTERDEDILRYVYKNIGHELAEVDEKYYNAKTNRTIAQKIFYKLMNLE